MGGSKNTTTTTMELPETEAQAPGKNGLYRLNYFNGRLLTAESLRKEQIYWDYRARLLGEIHPPGVAWGMSLTCDHPWKAPDKPSDGGYKPVGGMSAGTKITLHPGLAFNGIGQPISVGQDFELKLADLMDQFRSNKTVVVDGGTSFFPCVCLAPMPCGDMPAGQALPAGPYLLLIDPKDSLEGEAKVMNQVCPGGSAACEKDGIRGGFVLSLARFPVDVPMETVESSWDLRSTLSAFYFDIYEMSQITRWARPFPLDEGNKDFCHGPGPFDRVAGHVPLAMVYVGSDGTILFVDPWIPRRSIAATASHGWHANLRGAPTAPAVIARLHQFECQVHDRFLAAGWPKDGGKKPLYFCPPVANTPATAFPAQIPNLYDLGFREIPPYGFLPIPPYPKENQKKLTLGYQRVQWASKCAKAYFADTNVYVYSVVALHDDDILEDMVKAGEKDNIVLRRCQSDTRDKQLSALTKRAPLFAWLFKILGKCGGLSMERLINREIEVVKLVVPMEGLRRKYPIVGAVKADLSTAPYSTWAAIAGSGGAAGTRYGGLVDVLFGELLGGAARPHGFIFYVKQRLVVLDALYYLLDIVLDILLLFQTMLVAETDVTTAPAPTLPAGDPTGAAPPKAPSKAPAAPAGGLVMKNTMIERGEVPAVPDVLPGAVFGSGGVGTGGDASGPENVADDSFSDEAADEGGVAGALGKLGLQSTFLSSMVNSFVPVRGRDSRYPTFDIATLRMANTAHPIKAFEAVSMLAADETTRGALVSAILLWAPELGLAGTWTAYYRTRESITKKLRKARPNDPTVESEARDRAIELLLGEHKGFALLKAAAVALPDEEVSAFEDMLSEGARAQGGRATSTLGQSAFYKEGYKEYSNARAAAAAEKARAAYGRRTLAEVAPEAAGSSSTPVEKVLSSAPSRLGQLVGARASAKVAAKVKADGAAISSAVNDLGASKVAGEPTFWNAYDESLARTEGDTSKALDTLGGLSAEYAAPVESLRTLRDKLGDKGYDEVLSALRGKA